MSTIPLTPSKSAGPIGLSASVELLVARAKARRLPVETHSDHIDIMIVHGATQIVYTYWLASAGWQMYVTIDGSLVADVTEVNPASVSAGIVLCPHQ